MKAAAVLLLGLLLTQPTWAQDLSWLSGHWFNHKTEEVWSQPVDGNLMGYNRQFKDKEIVFFEHLRIEKREGKVLYQACPLGKSWTTFELVESGVADAVFSNPNHDFPQRLHYHRQGDTLRVRISGEGHESVSWSFTLKSL
jgi:hypothetical protein